MRSCWRARRRPWSSLLFLGALLGAEGSARADLANHFGLNPRSMALGGAYSAVAEDLAALYYNPAGLVQLEGFTAGAGLFYGEPFLAEDSTQLKMPSELSYYLHMGIPFSGKLKRNLALGVSLNMPWGSHLHTTLQKKDDPYFVLYDASVRVLQLRVGGGVRVPWRPLSFLTLGAAIQVLGSISGAIGFYAPYQRGGSGGAEDPDSRLEAWADIDVPTVIFGVVGIMAQIGERWRLGLTYRSAQRIDVHLPISLNTRLKISESAKIHIPVSGNAEYTGKYFPQQATLGVSYRWKRLLFSGELTWIDYSTFIAPIPRVKLDADRLNQDPGLSLLLGPDGGILDPREPRLEWTDVLVPRVGVEYQILGWLTGRAGYFYERSPLEGTDFPIYDCDKLGFSLGGRASFLRPWGLIPGWLHIDITLQEIVYVGRRIIGSEVGGNILAIAFGMEVVFL